VPQPRAGLRRGFWRTGQFGVAQRYACTSPFFNIQSFVGITWALFLFGIFLFILRPALKGHRNNRSVLSAAISCGPFMAGSLGYLTQA